jgi:hypothetical protein
MFLTGQTGRETNFRTSRNLRQYSRQPTHLKLMSGAAAIFSLGQTIVTQRKPNSSAPAGGHSALLGTDQHRITASRLEIDAARSFPRNRMGNLPQGSPRAFYGLDNGEPRDAQLVAGLRPTFAAGPFGPRHNHDAGLGELRHRARVTCAATGQRHACRGQANQCYYGFQQCISLL